MFLAVQLFHPFVISIAWAASNCNRPLPPCFLRTYKRYTSAFGWCCPWMISSFLVFLSIFCSSYWCRLTIPKLYLSTGNANDPIAWILFFGLNSVPRINFNLLNYFFFKFSFPFLCCISWLSFMSHFIYTALESSLLMSFSNVFTTYALLWTLSFYKHIFAHFSSPKFILISLLIAVTIFIPFSKSTPFLPGSFKPAACIKWLIFLSVPCTYIHNQLCSARVLMEQKLYRRVMAKQSPPGTVLSYLNGLLLQYFLLCFWMKLLLLLLLSSSSSSLLLLSSSNFSLLGFVWEIFTYPGM